MLTTDSPLPFPDWVILLMSIQGEASPDSCFMDQGSGIRDTGYGIRDTGYGIRDTVRLSSSPSKGAGAAGAISVVRPLLGGGVYI